MNMELRLEGGSWDGAALDAVRRLGYATVALESALDEERLKAKTSERDRVPAPPPRPHSDMRLLNRITVCFADPACLHRMNNSENLRKYDIVAARPRTPAALKHACLAMDVDLISHTADATFKIDRKAYKCAVRRGILFELSYAPALADAERRRDLVRAARLFRPEHLLLSSGASNPYQIRAPADVENLSVALTVGKRPKANIHQRVLLKAGPTYMEQERFYSQAAEYWKGIPATLDGVLGGFGFLSEPDAAASLRFLSSIFRGNRPPGRKLALDCGAGIGRITKDVLTEHFDKVDLIDQNEAFMTEAPQFIGKPDRIGNLYATGLQDFEPTEKYDVIWCQWVLGHLKDDHLVKFLCTVSDALSENGMVIVKENVTSSGEIEKDSTDSSITRPLDHLRSIFKKAKLKTVKECKQTDFPKGIYPVHTFALRPSSKKSKKNAIKENTIPINTSPKLDDAVHQMATLSLESNPRTETES